jgi:hypothetical protein
MARDHDAGQFEWVNVWASASGATTDVATDDPEPEAAKPAPPPAAPELGRLIAVHPARETETSEPKLAPLAIAPLPDQLMRDIAEIERARDALAAGPLGRRMRTFMVVPARTVDSVPLFVGGVLALVMLTVFATAAVMTKFGR